jgi:hypothetical protein
MIILGSELEQGYLTRKEYDDYVNLFRRAAEKVFERLERGGEVQYFKKFTQNRGFIVKHGTRDVYIS